MVFAMYLIFACIVLQVGATEQNCAVKLSQKAAVGSSLLMKTQRMSKILLDTKLHEHASSENDVKDATVAKQKVRLDKDECIFKLYTDDNCQLPAWTGFPPAIEVTTGSKQVNSASRVKSVSINNEGCKLTVKSSQSSGPDKSVYMCGGAAIKSCQTLPREANQFEMSTGAGCQNQHNDNSNTENQHNDNSNTGCVLQSDTSSNCVFRLFKDDHCKVPLWFKGGPTGTYSESVSTSNGWFPQIYADTRNPSTDRYEQARSVTMNHERCKFTKNVYPSMTVCGDSKCQICHSFQPAETGLEMSYDEHCSPMST